MAQPGIGDSVEGLHAVAAALEAGRVRSLLVERGSVENVLKVVEEAERRNVRVEFVDDLREHATTTAPQGVVAHCRPLLTRSLDDAIAATSPAAILVLDHIVDPRNVGAIARTALAAGILGFVVTDRRAAPLGATAFKAAAGAFERLTVVEVSSVAGALSDLKRRDVWVVGLDADGDQPLFGLGLLTEPVAIVLGAEGTGLSRLVRERADVIASIPLMGGVESLNVSVAAGLAAYEVLRARA